ncbi:MAG: hypothetical protein AABZ74_16690 [Cyanobacteriota bacterium]
MKIKKYISTFIAMALVSCAPNIPNTQINKVSSSNEKINVVSQLQEVNINGVVRQDTNFLTVSEKGADLRINLSFSEASSFKISANTDGVAEKKLTDVSKVDVYVLELSSAPTAGTDPFGTANANVFKSFTDVAKTDSGTGFNILLKGLPTNNTGKSYFVGIVVKDTAGNAINKAPTTPWTGATLTNAPNIRITGTGVSVDNALVVSITTALTLSLPLLDAVGAKLSSNIGINNGGTGGAIANSINFNLDASVIAGGYYPSFGTDVILSQPFGIKIDNSGNIYISNTSRNMVEKIDTAGRISIVVGNSLSLPATANYIATQNATDVSLSGPKGLEMDSAGNVYIADSFNNIIEKVDTAGKIKVIAGAGVGGVNIGTSGTNDATSANLFGVRNLALDNSGNIYFSVAGIIGKIDTAGKIKVIAGGQTSPLLKPNTSGTQNATNVTLTDPNGLSVDTVGNIYISDTANGLIEKVDTAGKIKVIAGGSSAGTANTSGTQNATNVKLLFPQDLELDSASNIYFSSNSSNIIYRIDTVGKIKVLAGNSTTSSSNIANTSGTQNATDISLNAPLGVGIDSAGNLYITKASGSIDKIDTAGKIKAIIGGTTLVPNTSGTQNATNINFGISSNKVKSGFADSTGNIYILDSSNSELEKIDTAGKIKVIAGGGTETPNTLGTQNATDVNLGIFNDVFVDSSNNIYISSVSSNLIQKIDTAGKIKVIAGGSSVGTANTSGTQNATDIKLNNPNGIGMDSLNNVYIVDSLNNLIEKIDTAGKIKVIAGGSSDGTANTSGTQNATDIKLVTPTKLKVDSTGNIYTSDFGRGIVKIDTAGKIKVIAGAGTSTTISLPNTSGTQNATNVRIENIQGIVIDSSNNIYIADQNTQLIEKIDTAGKIKVIAGNSTTGPIYGDTSITKKATNLSLRFPTTLFMDSSSNLYTIDDNNSLLKLVGL